MASLSQLSRASDGTSHGHHGEFLQGLFEVNGDHCRGLITVPCVTYWSKVSIRLRNEKGIAVNPAHKTKTRRAVEKLDFAESQLQARVGLELTIESNIPEGKGLGSSTADITAAARAYYGLIGTEMADQQVADISIQSEIASDPLVFGQRPVLFAQRQGSIIEELGEHFPPVAIISLDTSPQGTFDTVATPPCAYPLHLVREFEELRAKAGRAVKSCDPKLMGEVALRSAEINDSYFPKPHFREITTLMKDTGAIGLQIAHSGTVVGLMYSVEDTELADKELFLAGVLVKRGVKVVGRFSLSQQLYPGQIDNMNASASSSTSNITWLSEAQGGGRPW